MALQRIGTVARELHDFYWILRIIRSCRNEWQRQTCAAMIELFEKRHKNARMTAELWDELRTIDNQISLTI